MAEQDESSNVTVEVTLPKKLVNEVRALGLDLNAEVLLSLSRIVARTHSSEKWAEENREALESYNAYIAEHGMALSELRNI